MALWGIELACQWDLGAHVWEFEVALSIFRRAGVLMLVDRGLGVVGKIRAVMGRFGETVWGGGRLWDALGREANMGARQARGGMLNGKLGGSHRRRLNRNGV